MVAWTLKADDSYTHQHMPEVSISSDPVIDEDGTVTGYVHKWDIEGYITGAGIPAAVVALKAAYPGEIDKIEIYNDTPAVVESIDTAGMSEGIKCDLSFPDGLGPEYITKRRYKIGLTSPVMTISGVDTYNCTYKITYQTDKNTLVTRTISGRMVDKAGKTSYTRYANFKNTQGWNSPPGGYNLESDTYTTKSDDSETSFIIVHKEYFEPYTSGVTDASVSTEESLDDYGNTIKSITGFFEGDEGACNNAIDSYRESTSTAVPLDESITRDDFSNRSNFSLRYIMAASSDTIYNRETLSINHQVTGFIHKPVLGGGNPIKQTTSVGVATATQTGVRIKVGSYPSEPSYEWSSASLVGRDVTRMPPQITRDGNDYLYELRYTYTYENNIGFGF